MSKKIFTSLGLMSGTSMDGVDVSLIKSDGINEFEVLLNEFYEFDHILYQELIELRDKLFTVNDLTKNQEKIKKIERNFTLFNGKLINDILRKKPIKLDLIGFHGQTILHLPNEKISKQIGDGNLLSQLTKIKVVNQFRQNDLNHNGQGAPLAPIFHYLVSKGLNLKFMFNFPISIINIGGITNVSQIKDGKDENKDIFAYDIAPGNCLIDEWVRKNSNNKIDIDGNFAAQGKVNDLYLNQAIENFEIKNVTNSLDIKNFDISFARGLNLEDGCATITKYTSYLISEGLKKIDQVNNLNTKNLFICGGGRKNKVLINEISKILADKFKFKPIDEYGINGDFVESQAFAFLAVRSFKKLPISFPSTTNCKSPCTGGEIIDN